LLATSAGAGRELAMGQANAVEWYADQDSPTDQGCLSAISGSLDDIEPPIAVSKFMEGLLEILRRPVSPIEEPVLKSVDMEEHGPDAFTVKVILDGKKLSAYGFGREDDCDRVSTWKKVTHDRAQMKIITEDYVPGPPMPGEWLDKAEDIEVLTTCHIKMLSSPTRIECWLFRAGQRVADEDLCKVLTNFTNAVIGGIQAEATAKVKIAAGPSRKVPGHSSAVSEAMDDHVYYEGFFDALVKFVKHNHSLIPGGRIEDVNDKEFHAVLPGPPGKEENETTIIIKHSEESGLMSIETRNKDTVFSRQFRQLHKDPLVYEAWLEDAEGVHSASKTFVRDQLRIVNAVIDKANSWFG
jgi:hypothetical protein